LNSLFGLALANKFRIPAVWHIREQLSSILYNIPQMIFSQMAGESVIKHILCISENEATKLPESKVTILHNFFILDKQPCPRKKPIMFLSMGSFSMDKGFWLLIDAVKMLKHFHTPEDFRVSIMGISTRSTITKKLLREKTSEDFTNKIYREGIAEYFEFLPPQIDIRPDLFSQFHVLIRPSLNNDPWGRDIIEAMSTGRAVIATGTYSKFVRDGLNGFLVPSSDPRLLAERMQQFIKNESLAMQFGEKSYGLAQKLFDPQSITRDIENIYNTMTSSV